MVRLRVYCSEPTRWGSFLEQVAQFETCQATDHVFAIRRETEIFIYSFRKNNDQLMVGRKCTSREFSACLDESCDSEWTRPITETS